MRKVILFAGVIMSFLSSCSEIESNPESEPIFPKGFRPIYGISEPTTGGSVLYTINYTTGNTTSIGTLIYQSQAVTKCRAIAQRNSDNQLFAISGINSNFASKVFLVNSTTGAAALAFTLYVTTNGNNFNVGDAEFDPGNGSLYMSEYATGKVYKMTAAELTTAQTNGTFTLGSSNTLTNTNVASIVGESNGNSFGLAFDLSANLFICNQNGSVKAQVDKTTGNIIGSTCTNSNTGSALGVGMCFTGGVFIVRYNKFTNPAYTPQTFLYSSTCTPGTPGTTGVSTISDITSKIDVCPGCE